MTRDRPGMRIDLRAGGPSFPPSRPRRRGGNAPLRFAHRGARARAPENTLAAFEAAVRLGADVIELDVRLSADGVPVVIHDDTVDRTTDGEGRVGRLTVRDLKRLDAGGWFAPDFRGERIPTLEETLGWARGRCGLNLELKEATAHGGAKDAGSPAGAAAIAAAVAQAIRRTRARDLLIISSFSRTALAAARAAMPRARLGFLASRTMRGLTPLHRQVGLSSLHPHVRLASRQRVMLGHRLGLAVFFWTANDAPLIRRLLALGCDGVMTDDPALFQTIGGPSR